MPTKLLAKQKGEWAEVCFAAEILRRGWRISRPYGDSCRYDCVVDVGGNLSRVQIKAVAARSRARYRPYNVSLIHHKHYYLLYSAREVDVMAVLILPQAMWYIVPLAAIPKGRRHISFAGDKKIAGGLEKYRDAWEVLKPNPRRNPPTDLKSA